jgi:SAM-dependent methyltransferase
LTAPDWHEDNAFWEALAPAFAAPERTRMAATDVAAFVSLLGLSPGARVLDLAAGAGAHAIELAKRGFAVTGVDRTRAFLDRARAAAQAAQTQVEWVEADMRSFSRDGEFDAVVNLYTSFGFFEDAGDDLEVARNLRRSLKPGGAALLELLGKEIVAGQFRDRYWIEVDGELFLEERKVARDWEWLESRWVVVSPGKAEVDARREFRVRHRLYSGAELRAKLLEAGFARVDLYGSFDGAPYDRAARRLVAVAR